MNGFNEQQKNAAIDLLVLGMYADGHLASVEDEQVRRLLSRLGFTSESDCSREFDASISRVSRYSHDPERRVAQVGVLANVFTTSEQRRDVYVALQDLLASERKTVPQEKSYLVVVEEALGV